MLSKKTSFDSDENKTKLPSFFDEFSETWKQSYGIRQKSGKVFVTLKLRELIQDYLHKLSFIFHRNRRYFWDGTRVKNVKILKIACNPNFIISFEWIVFTYVFWQCAREPPFFVFSRQITSSLKVYVFNLFQAE